MANPIFSTESDCTFIWKIQNINCLWLKQHEKLDSPEFVVHKLKYNTDWKLQLYHRGYSSANDIGFFLWRCPCKDKYSINIIAVYFELAFLSENGSILCSRQSEKCTFYEHSCHGFDLFVNRDNVFVQNKSTYLPLNTLTARCKIWRCDKTFHVNQSFFARTRVLVHELSFQWPIDNFKTFKCNENKSLQISSSNDNCAIKTLKFDLYLAAKQFSEEIIFIDIDVSNMDAKYLSFKTFLLDTYGNFKDTGSKEFLFNDSEKKGTLILLLYKNQIINEGSYLKNDELTLHCECIYSTGMCSELMHLGRASYTVTPLVQNVGGFPSDDTVSLREDLLYLHNHDILSDMTLRTATNTIPVHTQILAARSPVFRAMFTNDMKEKIEGCINVPDLDDGTVRRMLLYMYTDKVEDLQSEEASELYTAADKYDIASLRSKCGAVLQAKLSPTNACQILSLVDKYQDKVLKKSVQDYITVQGKAIFNSEEWKRLMETNLPLAAETMHKNWNKD